MNTNKLIYLSIAGLTASCSGFGKKNCSNCGSKAKTDISKPNIIYVLVDDLGYGDLGCYGQKQIKTPNIDRMSKEGMLFTNHYAGNTVSAPSRCSLMTGKHMGHARIRANANVALLPEDITVAEILKEQGYKTALIGKWGCGEKGSTGEPLKKGFDYFDGYLNQIRAHNSFPEWIWKNNDTMKLDNKVEIIPESYAKGIGSIATEQNTHSHDIFTKEALSFIDSNAHTPFFLYLAYTIPHANDESWYWKKCGMETPDMMGYDTTDWPEAQQKYAAMVTYMDRDIGKILKKVTDLELRKNTIIIFTSDNGPHEEGGFDPTFFNSAGGLKGIKRDLYEGGIRVPMIAWWPGKIASGTVSNHISAFWDFFPTACDIAGSDTPEGLDGISFLPELLGKEQKKHDYLYWEFKAKGGRQAIRKNNWKAVKYNMTNNFDASIELYDLSKDIGEENNVADKNPEVIQEMKKVFKEARNESESFKFEFEK